MLLASVMVASALHMKDVPDEDAALIPKSELSVVCTTIGGTYALLNDENAVVDVVYVTNGELRTWTDPQTGEFMSVGRGCMANATSDTSGPHNWYVVKNEITISPELTGTIQANGDIEWSNRVRSIKIQAGEPAPLITPSNETQTPMWENPECSMFPGMTPCNYYCSRCTNGCFCVVEGYQGASQVLATTHWLQGCRSQTEMPFAHPVNSPLHYTPSRCCNGHTARTDCPTGEAVSEGEHGNRLHPGLRP